MRPRAVVLAAGRGTRLRRGTDHRLTPAQAEAADRGLKALVPIHGRPYLAYVLDGLARAGYRDVCLVVRDLDDAVARAASGLDVRRLRLAFAVQPDPLGTADAVLAAEPETQGEPFVVINGDNVYPAAALEALGALEGSGLVGFDATALVARSNIPARRLHAFGLVRQRDGWLERVLEKPDPPPLPGPGIAVSMTCWRFAPSIFEACRAVAPSSRGELELTDAVDLAIVRGERFRVLPVAAGVLDLSVRSDIPELERWLAGREPSL
jgi:dTDP-glucose pyrophosphorylase